MICQFCTSDRFKPALTVYSGVTRKEVRYYVCKKCGSICQYPLPGAAELAEYYSNYQTIKAAMNPGYLESKQLGGFFAERDKTLHEIRFDLSGIKEAHNVELGCANGHFLQYLHHLGAQRITGIDISRPLLDAVCLEEAVLIQGDLGAVPENSVDNLFLFNVLEHAGSVTGLMEQVQSRLKKGGQLVLEVPLAGLVFEAFKNKWRFLMADEHLNIPSYPGLVQLLARYGFIITGKTRFGSGFTTGMIHKPLKNLLDKSAKICGFGDRGAFLCKKP